MYFLIMGGWDAPYVGFIFNTFAHIVAYGRDFARLAYGDSFRRSKFAAAWRRLNRMVQDAQFWTTFAVVWAVWLTRGSGRCQYDDNSWISMLAVNTIYMIDAVWFRFVNAAYNGDGSGSGSPEATSPAAAPKKD